MSELRAIARGVPGAEWRRIVTYPNPAAGTDVSIPCPGGRCWQVLGVACTFTAANVAGNRDIVLKVIDNDGNALVVVPILAPIILNTAKDIAWYTGLGATVTGPGADLALPLPLPLYMFPGETITITGHTNAGDTFTKVRATVIETYTGDAIHQLNTEQAIRDHAEALHELIVGG